MPLIEPSRTDELVQRILRETEAGSSASVDALASLTSAGDRDALLMSMSSHNPPILGTEGVS